MDILQGSGCTGNLLDLLSLILQRHMQKDVIKIQDTETLHI